MGVLSCLGNPCEQPYRVVGAWVSVKEVKNPVGEGELAVRSLRNQKRVRI